MSRNREYIEEAFDIYYEALGRAVETGMNKRDKIFFDEFMKLNNKHLLDNLDKAMVLFKEEAKPNEQNRNHSTFH